MTFEALAGEKAALSNLRARLRVRAVPHQLLRVDALRAEGRASATRQVRQ